VNQVEYRDFITREDVRREPDKIFLFGDNLAQSGLAGQAREMRGEPNAIGIPTKRAPNNQIDSFFFSKDYKEAVAAIDAAFNRIPEGVTVVIPSAGIGTGLARLEDTCLQLLNYIRYKIWGLNRE
jgi:hypothetical protein